MHKVNTKVNRESLCTDCGGCFLPGENRQLPAGCHPRLQPRFSELSSRQVSAVSFVFPTAERPPFISSGRATVTEASLKLQSADLNFILIPRAKKLISELIGTKKEVLGHGYERKSIYLGPLGNPQTRVNINSGERFLVSGTCSIGKLQW